MLHTQSESLLYIHIYFQKNSTVWILETLLRKSNQQPSHLSSLGLQPHNLPMTHLNFASIGNQWKTGKTWSPGTEGEDQYQQETDVRTKEGGRKRQRQAAKYCGRKDLVKFRGVRGLNNPKNTQTKVTLNAAASQRQAFKFLWNLKQLY